MSARINKLYKKSLQIVEKEIEHLKVLATVEKLTHANAADLGRYVKLLSEMKEAELAIKIERKAHTGKKASTLTDEQLKAQLLEGRPHNADPSKE